MQLISAASRLVHFRKVFLTILLAFSGTSALAVTRTIDIAAPESVLPGAEVKVQARASTDAGGGEKIGFFHAEYSIDSGKSWTGFSYDQNLSETAMREVTFKSGAAGSKILVRVRIAFRGGPAGDVDYNGSAIEWTGSWEKWRVPPAKMARVAVVEK